MIVPPFLLLLLRANRVQPGGDDGAHGGGGGGGARIVRPSCEAESIGKPQLKTRFIGLLATTAVESGGGGAVLKRWRCSQILENWEIPKGDVAQDLSANCPKFSANTVDIA